MVTNLENKQIAVIGLGYVGLPLLVEFSKFFDVTGYDIDERRIQELKSGIDSTKEVTNKALKAINQEQFTQNLDNITDANIYIVTVPTPIDNHNQPDLRPLKAACRDIGKIIKPDDLVIFESTVYPGTTEEICSPIIEKQSSLKLNEDFFIGYSPERVNPGDSSKRINEIVKVTSGSTEEIANLVDELYSKIITVGTYKAPSIKVAEAAKVIENTQRDLNIALVNELSKIFNLIDIDTEEVIKAAATKWNFVPMKPGLVGGHCIGVDPYYLTYKAQDLGYDPEVILSGRRLNNSMAPYIADRCLELMLERKKIIDKSIVLIMGYTFKENCPDIRNTRIIDIVNKLEKFCEVRIFDPWVEKKDLDDHIALKMTNDLEEDKYDALIIAVAHDAFNEMNESDIRKSLKPNSPILDVKGIFPKAFSDFRL